MFVIVRCMCVSSLQEIGKMYMFIVHLVFHSFERIL